MLALVGQVGFGRSGKVRYIWCIYFGGGGHSALELGFMRTILFQAYLAS